MGFDNAYEAITEEVDDHRWAFGTGFTDPLLGVDASVPSGVSGTDLGGYCEMLADDALVFSQRLQQWLTRAPELEEETALANVALDLLGQARLLYTRAGQVDGSGRSEDDFAYRRGVEQFRNVCLVEPVDDDFAALVVRLLVFASWRLAVVEQLQYSRDAVIAAVAGKAIPELTYHRDYAAQWVVRLGDGTDFSRDRTVRALHAVLPAAGELWAVTDLERALAGVGIAADPAAVREQVAGVLRTVTEQGGLPTPVVGDGTVAGRAGAHTPGLPELLDELQSVARAYPAAAW